MRCGEDPTGASLLSCGRELALCAALPRWELQPGVSHHVPAGPGREVPVPSWGSGTLLHLVSGERWSTGSKRQQNHDRFVLPVQGWVREMETTLTCVCVTVECALSLGKEHGDDVDVPLVPWESQQCAGVPETP